MDILSLVIAVLNRDSWNLAPRTGLTQGIRIWSRKLRFLKMTVHFREIKNLKSTKNGSSKKKLKKRGKQITLKLPVNILITQFNIAESKFEISFGKFLQKMPQNGRWKACFFAFFDFWLLIPWFEVFTIQKRQFKLEIRNPRPDISLETKFRPIIIKTVDRIFFSRTTHIFPISKT